MNLENQVCSLSQSKKIKELGIFQDSIWFWTYPVNEKKFSSSKGLIHQSVKNDIIGDNEGDEFDHDIAAAFSVAELGLMLPDMLTTNLQYELVCIKEDECWVCRYCHNNDICDLHPTAPTRAGETEAEARSELLIGLLVKKLITVDEVNKRLTE